MQVVVRTAPNSIVGARRLKLKELVDQVSEEESEVMSEAAIAAVYGRFDTLTGPRGALGRGGRSDHRAAVCGESPAQVRFGAKERAGKAAKAVAGTCTERRLWDYQVQARERRPQSQCRMR